MTSAFADIAQIVLGFAAPMLLRDRLRARLAEMGDVPDHQRPAAEVLGIRNAPPDLARRLVSQALVVEDRRDAWGLVGERICATAPATPGVYVLRDDIGRALYVGKAINLRRRLRTHFAGQRWRGLKAELARATDAEWRGGGAEAAAAANALGGTAVAWIEGRACARDGRGVAGGRLGARGASPRGRADSRARADRQRADRAARSRHAPDPAGA